MLLSNQINLFREVVDFINNEDNKSVRIFSAYIRDDFLKALLKKVESIDKIKLIVTRFKNSDLHKGSSDLEVFKTCQDNGIYLYRNIQLHGKCIVSNSRNCILGSANYTKSGMYSGADRNWEINTELINLDLMSYKIFDQIIEESDLFTEDLYIKTKEYLNQLPKVEELKYKPIRSKLDKSFLLSSLPLSDSPETIWKVLNGEYQTDSYIISLASHDIALYKIADSYITKKDFLEDLSVKFKAHPFIKRFYEYLKNKPGKYMVYNHGTSWLSENCVDVPTPSRYTIKDSQIVDPLYYWMGFFFEDVENDNKFIRNEGSNTVRIKK